MLVNWYVLKVVLVLLLAAKGQLGALIQLISVSLSWNVHHDEIFAQLILVCIIHPHGIMIHLTVVLHSSDNRGVLRMDSGGTNC